MKKKMPKPINLNDCVLLWQMGYRVEINDGRVTAVVKEVSDVSKTLREIMGLRDSIGDIRIGDTVRIIASGHIGKVELIGQHGLLSISGVIGPFAPWEVEKVIEKEKNGLKAAK